MVLAGIHHVGCATDDAGGLAERLAGLFDVSIAHKERFEGLQVVFLEVGDSYFEVLEPIEEEGAIARYLETNDGGLHHVAFATPDIEAALERARNHGVELVDESPRAGAWDHTVAFLHPRTTGGILIELVGA